MEDDGVAAPTHLWSWSLFLNLTVMVTRPSAPVRATLFFTVLNS